LVGYGTKAKNKPKKKKSNKHSEINAKAISAISNLNKSFSLNVILHNFV